MKQIGTARCRQCQAGYQTVINCTRRWPVIMGPDCSGGDDVDLSEPIDIFAEWIDAIDVQNRQRTTKRQRLAAEEAKTVSESDAKVEENE